MSIRDVPAAGFQKQQARQKPWVRDESWRNTPINSITTPRKKSIANSRPGLCVAVSAVVVAPDSSAQDSNNCRADESCSLLCESRDFTQLRR